MVSSPFYTVASPAVIRYFPLDIKASVKRLEVLEKDGDQSDITSETCGEPLFTPTIFHDVLPWPEVLRIPQLFTLTGGEAERRLGTTGDVEVGGYVSVQRGREVG